MLEKIAQELWKAGQGADREQLLAIAPSYLFSVKKGNGNSIAFALEQLLRQLEKQNLFSRQTDGLLCLSVDYGNLDNGIGEVLGFWDDSGRFKMSLEQWMSCLDIQYQIRQGIVWIRIHWRREFQSEMIWWKRFFRQMNRYKSDFLFLFQTEEKDAAMVQERLAGECFCRRIPVRQLDASDYAGYFKRGLENASLCLDEQGEKVLVEILENNLDGIDSQVVGQWQQELVWEYFLEDREKEKEPQVFPVSRITETSLRKYLGNSRISSGIGFEVKAHETD